MSNQQKNEFLPTIQDNEFLPTPSRWTTIGGLFIAGSVGVAVALASVIKYNVTVPANGTIRPEEGSSIAVAPIDSKVKKIVVEEGDPVEKGQTLIELDNSNIETRKQQLQDNLESANEILEQVNAQIELQEKVISGATDGKKQSVSVAKTQLELAQKNHNNAQQEVQEAKKILEEQQKERNKYQQSAKTDEIAKFLLPEKEAAVNAAEERLKRAQNVFNSSQAALTTAQTQIKQAETAGDSNHNNLKVQLKEFKKQKGQVQQQIDDLTRQIKHFEQNNPAVITAPTDGIITQINPKNSQEPVLSGQRVAHIVPPANAPLVIEAWVASKHRGKLALDQKTLMRVSACPYTDYGTLKGRVIQIFPDTVDPQGNNVDLSLATGTATGKQGAKNTTFYKVEIKPDSKSVGRANKKECELRSGYEGTVKIISGEETVLTFILRKAKIISGFDEEELVDSFTHPSSQD